MLTTFTPWACCAEREKLARRSKSDESHEFHLARLGQVPIPEEDDNLGGRKGASHSRMAGAELSTSSVQLRIIIASTLVRGNTEESAASTVLSKTP